MKSSQPNSPEFGWRASPRPNSGEFGYETALCQSSPIERGATWLLAKVRRLGAEATRWAEAMIQLRGVESVRVLYGLLSLTKRYPSTHIARPATSLTATPPIRLRTVRALKRQHEAHAARPQCFDFMDERPLIRPLAEYAKFVRTSFQKEASSERHLAHHPPATAAVRAAGQPDLNLYTG